ncbi:MAG: esterase-like activity of phytase family protein [Terricaulis sp.]
MALMRDEHAEPFPNKAAGDSEGLAQLLDGRFAVSFEQTQTIRIYDLNRDGPFGAAAPGPALSETQHLPSNQGLEALAVAGDGALIVGAEGGSDNETTLWRAPLNVSTPAPPAARYPLEHGFALTSLDHLPDGGFVALERFYAPVIGARTRITMFGEDVFGGGAVAPQELAALRPPLEIDNFEAVSAVRMPGNITRLYILSDNNFSERQRTLLYAFDIVGEGG